GEFCTMQVPDSLTREQTWDILNALRRQMAVDLPFRDGDGRRGWYYPTHSILADLDDIDRRCQEGSWLDTAIKSRNTTYFLIESHVNEAITIIREDGLNISYEKAREVLLGERDPENSDEQLLSNGFQALWDLDEYAEQTCTPELIFSIFEKISDGVDNQTTDPITLSSPFWKSAEHNSQEILSLVSNLINGNKVEHAEHPVYLGMAIRYLFMSTFPLPAWNGTMYSLMMKLLFKKSRLPALAFIPIIKAFQERRTDRDHLPNDITEIANTALIIGDEVDYTVYDAIVARLVRQAIDEVEDDLKRAIRRDEVFVQELRDRKEINQRQRSVLQLALSDPKVVFRIESHRKTHHVAYATARADLMELADLGFLQCIQKRRAFEFHVMPGLRQLLTAYTRNTNR
ncbi:MAG: hypothetical protein RR505_00605, partial [Raoultibacter sp.]